MGLTRLASRTLDSVWRLSRSARLSLLRKARFSQLNRPNSASEWSALYPETQEIVREVKSPIVQALLEWTSPGDVLLEAGCGHARLSAELAVAGRVIELCDFSPEILQRAVALFQRSSLPPPRVTLADITGPLPWAEGAVD
jgi:SAM-dependent methyltransferase